MRAILTALHRYGGLAMAGFLIIAGLSGSILAFRFELDSGLNPHLFRVEPTGAALPVSQLVAHVERADPAVAVLTILPATKAGETASAYVGPRDGRVVDYNQVFLDPATGRILGRRMDGAFRLDRAHVIPLLYRFHYSLLIPGWGTLLMGVVAVAWLVDCFVGWVLTLPRGRPFWRKWRPIWGIKQGAGGYRLNLDLHRATGLWLWPVLFLLALSSMALNLNHELFRPVLSALLPTSPSIWDRPSPAEPPAMVLDWDAAVAAAQAEAGRRGLDGPVGMIYAARAQGFYMLRVGHRHAPGFGTSALFISGVDGSILSVDEAGGGQAGDRIAGLMFPLHSGQIAGLPGRILICIAGLAVAMLSVTGIYIWWKKRAARLSRKASAAGVPRQSHR